MPFFCKLLLLILLITFKINFVDAASGRGAIIKSDETYYDANSNIITAKGHVFIQIDGYNISADKVTYDQRIDLVYAEGNLKIVDDKERAIYGEKAVFKDKFKKAIIQEFTANLGNNSILVAQRAKRVGENRVILEKSVFTPCEFNCSNKPIWQINAAKTDIDYDKQKITYRNLFFEIYGIPVIYLPYFSHPSPRAKEQSGLLTPKIKNDNLLIPFYFRPKPNLDFTVSPRLAKDSTIIEGQFRHKVDNGSYEILGSYGNPPLVKLQNNGEKTHIPGRYHIFASGSFIQDDINFGFNINRTSDKAYLTNYLNIFDSYLKSKIYANVVDKRNYISLEGNYFQDLRAIDKRKGAPFIFPNLQVRKVYSLNDSETLLFYIKSDTIAYKEPENLGLARTSLDLELMNNIITDNGHMFTNSLANRYDLYWVDFSENGKSYGKHPPKQHVVWNRNIPEVRTRWRYPLVKSLNNKTTIKLEPTAMLVVGKKYEERFNKYPLIDSNKNELSENNLFQANRFSGIDYHDYGTRLSYGMNSSLMSQHFYVDAFLGQLLHKNNVSESGNSEYVGCGTLALKDNFEIFYRFRRDRKLNPVRAETGASVFTENLNATTTLTELHNISKYFAEDKLKPEKEKVTQLNFDINYQLKKNLWIGGESRLDIAGAKTNILVRTIKVTYLFDCVSISGSITDNFLHDNLRGVKKRRSNTFAIGLKVINM